MRKDKNRNKSGQRPVLHIPLSTSEILVEIAALVGVLLTVVVIVQSWPTLPDTIPTHFGVSGQPDAWGSRVSLWLLPGISILLVYIPLTIFSRFPHIGNYPWNITEENAETQYQLVRSMMGWIKAETVWLITYIIWKTIQVACGKASGLGTTFLWIFLLLIFLTPAIYFYRAYRAR